MVLIPYIISTFCLWILLSAIALNFYFSKKNAVVKEKKSIVETGSMLAFFMVTVLLVYLKIGALELNEKVDFALAVLGTILIVAGTGINVAGRLALKENWGNQIRIYEHHTLVESGVYRYIRHPLYSSTILMMYGFSFLFTNPIVFLLNTIIFFPFMVYRAKQEDAMLAIVFPDTFSKYKSKTGLFIPKLKKEAE